MKRLLPLLALAGCTQPNGGHEDVPPGEPSAFMAALPDFEGRTGGTLGVVLLDAAGRETLVSWKADERMAFCSAFKFALGGAALQAANEGAIDLDRPVSYEVKSLPGHSPVLAQGDGTTSLRDAIAAAVTMSDNGAANLLIDALGEPDAVTRRWRGWGDETSRLDRREVALNENAPGDPRDTSSPKAMARTLLALDRGEILSRKDRDWLFTLGEEATSGLDRVRGGLPEGWKAGDKIGTCKGSGQPDQQVNDIGWIDHPNGMDRFYFAVMVQRPTASVAETEAIMAEIGAHLALAIGE